MQTIQQSAKLIALQAKKASQALLKLLPQQIDTMLLNLADSIEIHKKEILEHNLLDIESTQFSAFINRKNLDSAFIDRLTLNDKRIEQMAQGVRQIANLEHIIGQISDVKVRPNGMKIGKMRMPLGVIAIIYEARPNVTIDAAALCLKSGNACILRGGSEALNTNKFLAQILAQNCNISNAVQVISTSDRQMITELVQLKDDIDVVIPRGGKGLIENLMQTSKIPMLKHLDGICHIYIDKDANIESALKISFNAKCHRYGTCNTIETLLIHKDIVDNLLPLLANKYLSENVELRCDKDSYNILIKYNYPYLKFATDEDWSTEYLAPILAVKIVNNTDEAIQHINTYGSKHTDAIISENYTTNMQFLQQVDSASVLINASTRLADGFEYGLGAEIGISNDKLHVRGPVGLEGLTNQKYVVFGNGEIRK